MKKHDLRFWRNPRWRYGSLSTLLLVLALAALVALNALFTALENRFAWRMDYSFNHVTTYSAETEKVLEALETPVVIYAMHERGYEDLQLFELLDNYCAASPMLSWEQRPLSLNTNLASILREAGEENEVSAQSLIVMCPHTGRYRLLTDTSLVADTFENLESSGAEKVIIYEYALTSAISYVALDASPVVYVVQGHGEATTAEANQFNTLLLESGFDLRYGELSQVTLAPEDLVVFLSPDESDLSIGEMTQLTDFIAAGGRLLFAATGTDPINPGTSLPDGMPNYRELLRLYGFIPLTGTVCASKDEPGTYDGRSITNLSAALLSTEFTLDLTLSSPSAPRIYMPNACAFQTPEEDAALIAPLLSSGDKAYLQQISLLSRSLEKTEADPAGPFTLGLVSTRFTESGEISRAVMLGSAGMLLDDAAHSNANNRTLILRAMDFLTGRESSSLSIAPKVAFRPALSVEAMGAGSLILVFCPLTVLTAAFLILFPRRHL